MSGEEGRRSFLGVLASAISAAVGVFMAIPLIRFASYPLSRRAGEAEWFPVGKVDSFAGAEPIRAEVEVRRRDGWRVTTSRQTVWVVPGAGGPKVLSAICTHLGCVVPWNAQLQEFACPCHRAFYARDGARISGPQPRGLDPLPTKIEGGTLFVRYQYFRQLVPYREVIG